MVFAQFTNAGGCSTSYQIVVPKSPKAYMWIFPEGCYTKCKEEVAYLLGPTLPINEWSWLLNQNPISSGSYSVPSNLPLSQSGTYNLQLNTGLCDLQSASMYLTAGDCSDCKLEVKEEKLYQNEGTLCTFTLILQITNNMGMDLQASILSNNNNLIVSPGSVTLMQGTHSYTFTVTPINGFLGGNVSMSIIGSYIKDTVISCVTKFDLKLPSCGGAQTHSSTIDQKTMAVVEKSGNIVLYPNPAHDKVNIRFETDALTSQVEVYDLMGRLISSFESTAKQGVVELDLAPMATGVYVVVLRKELKS